METLFAIALGFAAGLGLWRLWLTLQPGDVTVCIYNCWTGARYVEFRARCVNSQESQCFATLHGRCDEIPIEGEVEGPGPERPRGPGGSSHGVSS